MKKSKQTRSVVDPFQAIPELRAAAKGKKVKVKAHARKKGKGKKKAPSFMDTGKHVWL